MTIENTPNAPQLHQVFAVIGTDHSDVFMVDVELTDMRGERYRAEYASVPGDTVGLAPLVRQWLTENEGSYVVAPYVEPTIEDLRAVMPSITARQLRLVLVRSGISLDSVAAAINAMPAGVAEDEARIEWEYATVFNRLHPTLLQISTALALTPEQVDALWEQALTIE